MITNPRRVEVDFSNHHLTGSGGLCFLSRMARRLDLFRELSGLRSLKRRRRGVPDAERTWSLIASLALGNGALSDLEVLGWDRTACELLGLTERPSPRRVGEHLARFEDTDVAALRAVGRKMAQEVVPGMARHFLDELGYVPLFLDSTQIEVRGGRFEGAARDYQGETGYQLAAAFVGHVQVSGRLRSGNTHPAHGWLEQVERDVEPLLAGVPVWGRMDNAYYRRDVVEHFEDRGWDYSVSVTSEVAKRPILDAAAQVLEDADWEEINEHERAALITHRPTRWRNMQTYVVVRQEVVGGERLLFPRHTVILVSRDDLDLKELVLRHRGKQGQENAFKGPLREMNLHHPRCMGFRANQAYYECALIAQLLVRAVQHRMLPKEARSRSLGYVIRHLMRTVAVLVRTGRRLYLNFARSNWELAWLLHAADSFGETVAS